MSATGPVDIVLLSRDAARHGDALAAWQRTGFRVEVSCEEQQAQAQLSRRPRIIAVDLRDTRWLSEPLIRALNSFRGERLVIALHDGTLSDELGPIAQLRVDGFCHEREWRPIGTNGSHNGHANGHTNGLANGHATGHGIERDRATDSGPRER